jgi:phosphatidylserine/phosphatidylglycerophosphate/cardiolipin synthase-like enzyme
MPTIGCRADLWLRPRTSPLLTKSASAVEGGEERHRKPDFVAANGIATYRDDEHPTAHNKIVIVDRAIVITGSFNLTEQAERGNAENLPVITRDSSEFVFQIVTIPII